MPNSIIHPYEWSTEDFQYFVTINSDRNELGLYESKYENKKYITTKLSTSSDSITRLELDPIQCYNYSPTKTGLFASGLLSGTVTVSNLKSVPREVMRLQPKQQRPCNSVSFNSQSLLAVALDKVRNDSSLQIYDLNRVQQNDSTPYSTSMPSEVVSSATFLRESPFLLICGTYKFLREYDTRVPAPIFEIATKFVQGVTIDRFSDNFFSTHSDSGTVAFWDRRQIRMGSSGSFEPVMTINPFGESQRGKNAHPCFRISSTRRGEFATLQDGYTIKRWQTGYVPPHIQHQAQNMNSASTNSSEPLKISYKDIPKQGYLFVTSIMKSVTPTNERITSFDYVADLEYKNRLNFICLTQSGSLVRMKAVESPTAVKFDPFNVVASVDREHITFIGPKASETHPSETSRRISTTSTESISGASDDGELNDGAGSSKNSKSECAILPSTSSGADTTNNSLFDVGDVLERDVSFSIRKLAMNNYSMDCKHNISLFDSYNHPNGTRIERLKAAWNWVDRAQRSRPSMVYGMVDFSYEGVLGIWEGFNWISKKVNNPNFHRAAFETAVSRILDRSKRKIFTERLSQNPAKRDLRQLCLRAAGWNFDISQLEGLLEKLESEGKYEQAAGWAVFHGRVNRAVKSLSASKNDRLRMMSAAIAGYDGYKNTARNTTWKELCRKMSSELENPYMRAVFAFIADGDWIDVLDEESLPLQERLGIALRFLSDDELTNRLYKMKNQAIENGDIDGIILTGITPAAVDLLQSYVDKTADVQTASLIISFASPLYFTDERATHWIECYRNLLNSWRLFSKRAMFDVARTRASKTFDDRITNTVVPPQVYLQCHNCKKVIRSMVNATGGESGSDWNIPPSGSGPGGGGPPAQRQESISSSPTNHLLMEPASYHRYYTGQTRFQSTTDINIRCPHCNYPLPRCAVCLLPLGALPSRMNHNNTLEGLQNFMGESNDQELQHTNGDQKSAMENKNLFDRYFVFCLSCNHGMHAGHAREWFSKHSMCAVPDCECNCNQYR